MKVSRRDFLKICGASAAMLGLGAKMGGPSAAFGGMPGVPVSPRPATGVLIDTTRCLGCRKCQTACKVANNLPLDPVPSTTLNATTLSVIQFRNVSSEADQPVVKPVKWACMHCAEPACVASCPVGALYKAADGHVEYDPNICIGCRYCMTACPFGMPKYNWDSADPKISKCSEGCLQDGTHDTPACVEACPAQALTYGARSELLIMAKTRINDNPGKYVDHVYGENEVGGTSRLYLSSVPFEQFGFRTDLPNEPLPDLTWNAQGKIPYVLVTVAAALSGIAWWTHRGETKTVSADETRPIESRSRKMEE